MGSQSVMGGCVEGDIHRRSRRYGSGGEAWFPDFPSLTVSGDRLADTLLSAPFALRRHVEHLRGDGLAVPEPTTPDISAIHGRQPEALVGFAEVETGQAGEEILED